MQYTAITDYENEKQQQQQLWNFYLAEMASNVRF